MADNNQPSGKFGLMLGGILAVAAAVFILTGGELGGKKTVQGDEDLPGVITSPQPK